MRNRPDLPLDGKVALVTGASRGIGKAIAIRLSQMGAQVALCARKLDELGVIEREMRAQGRVAKAIQLDVTQESGWTRALDIVRSGHDRLDILVNNAGIGTFGKPLHESSLSDFEDMIATNLRGVFLGMKTFTPLLIATGGGDIVNISSLASKNPVKNGAIYAASKAAVTGLSISAAEELREHKIRVSTICPGSTATELILGMNTDTSRMLQPEDIADAVAMIVTQEPRSFISEVLIRPTQKP